MNSEPSKEEMLHWRFGEVGEIMWTASFKHIESSLSLFIGKTIIIIVRKQRKKEIVPRHEAGRGRSDTVKV